MSLSRKTSLWIALFFCCGPHFATAADAPAANTPANTELVTLNMRDADIRAVTQWIAEQTHKQIVIDPRVEGRVTALADHPITVAQAYQVFLAILSVHGYSTSETDGIVRIYPAALSRLSPKAVVDDFSTFGESGQVMHIAELKNVAAPALVELTRPLVSQNGYIAPLADSNSLIIADDSSNVKRLLELIQRMDSLGSLEFDVIKLQHANARDIAKVLESLTKVSATGSGGGGGAATAPLSIAADERSNSVLLTGDPVNRQRSKQLILQLDRPIDTTAASRVIFLKYLSAAEIVPILKNVTNTAQKESKEEEVKQADISIEASQSNNAVVLSGPPTLLDNMQDIITKLDVQRAQVLVEAVIVELDQDLTNELGVQWRTDFENTGAQGGTNFGLQGIPIPGSTNPLTSLGKGLTLGYYDGGSLRALLHALSSNTRANILSTPSIMALDNQQAQIVVGSNIPLITGQATSSGSPTNDPFTTYERKDIGVTLKITPLVNSGSSVTLDIVQEVQSIAPSLGFNDIVTNKRSITTKVLVNDDRTIVLGGLVSNQEEETVDKVPILGDLPLIGKLFSSTSTTVKKQNLMVFIHPVIIDSEALARDVSQTRYEDMRVRQMTYQDGKMTSDIGKDQPVEPLPEFENISPRQKQDVPAEAPAIP
jgi:general secretion pathway protein D